jgi:hypothetical protein
VQAGPDATRRHRSGQAHPIVIGWPFEEVRGGRIDGFPYGATV